MGKKRTPPWCSLCAKKSKFDTKKFLKRYRFTKLILHFGHLFGQLQLVSSLATDSMSATERYEDDIKKATELYKIAKKNGSLEATKAQ